MKESNKKRCILTDIPKYVKHSLLHFLSTLISKLFLQLLTDSSFSLGTKSHPMEFIIGLKPHGLILKSFSTFPHIELSK